MSGIDTQQRARRKKEEDQYATLGNVHEEEGTCRGGRGEATRSVYLLVVEKCKGNFFK
jgi:hypothetical protein